MSLKWPDYSVVIWAGAESTAQAIWKQWHDKVMSWICCYPVGSRGKQSAKEVHTLAICWISLTPLSVQNCNSLTHLQPELETEQLTQGEL